MHLLRIATRVADGVEDPTDGPDPAERCSNSGVLHSGDEGACKDRGQALERVLVSA